MQYSDYKRDEYDIKGEIDRLVSTGILTKAQAESIDIYKLMIKIHTQPLMLRILYPMLLACECSSYHVSC